MTFLSVLAGIMGSIMAGAGFIQTYKIFKTRSAKDISFLTYILIAIGGVVWVLYGFEINSGPIIISNSIVIVAAGCIIVGWWIYGRGV
jgi:MtN3 and saliva related transmembrane protein